MSGWTVNEDCPKGHGAGHVWTAPTTEERDLAMEGEPAVRVYVYVRHCVLCGREESSP